MRFIIHYGLHFGLPLVIAKKFYAQNWKRVWLILTATMLIDLDHLLSDPIYDPNRLSIGNHLLHSYPAILLYLGLLIPKKTRVVGIGLLLHILTDLADFCWT